MLKGIWGAHLLLVTTCLLSSRLIRVEKCIHLLRVVHQHRRYESEERNN